MTILLLGLLIAGGLAAASALGACSSDSGDCTSDTDAGTGGVCATSPTSGGW